MFIYVRLLSLINKLNAIKHSTNIDEFLNKCPSYTNYTIDRDRNTIGFFRGLMPSTVPLKEHLSLSGITNECIIVIDSEFDNLLEFY